VIRVFLPIPIECKTAEDAIRLIDEHQKFLQKAEYERDGVQVVYTAKGDEEPKEPKR